jgi:hypothetical protein
MVVEGTINLAMYQKVKSYPALLYNLGLRLKRPPLPNQRFRSAPPAEMVET